MSILYASSYIQMDKNVNPKQQKCKCYIKYFWDQDSNAGQYLGHDMHIDKKRLFDRYVKRPSVLINT